MTRVLPTEHLTAMCKAMRKAGLIVNRDNAAGTCLAFTRKGDEIFFALETSGGNWLIRHHDDLFVTK